MKLAGMIAGGMNLIQMLASLSRRRPEKKWLVNIHSGIREANQRRRENEADWKEPTWTIMEMTHKANKPNRMELLILHFIYAKYCTFFVVIFSALFSLALFPALSIILMFYHFSVIRCRLVCTSRNHFRVLYLSAPISA